MLRTPVQIRLGSQEIPPCGGIFLILNYSLLSLGQSCFKQFVVIFPELALVGGAKRSFGGLLGVGMNLGQRKLLVIKYYLTFIVIQDLLDRRISSGAIRALEIRKLDQLYFGRCGTQSLSIIDVNLL